MKNFIKLATASILVCFSVATFAQAPMAAPKATAPAKSSEVTDKNAKQHDDHWKQQRLTDNESKHPGFKEWVDADPARAAQAKQDPDKALKDYRASEDAKRAEHKDKKGMPEATPGTVSPK